LEVGEKVFAAQLLHIQTKCEVNFLGMTQLALMTHITRGNRL